MGVKREGVVLAVRNGGMPPSDNGVSQVMILALR